MVRKRTILSLVLPLSLSLVRPTCHLVDRKNESKTVTIGVMAGSKAEDEIWASTIKTAKNKYSTLKTKKFMTIHNQQSLSGW